MDPVTWGAMGIASSVAGGGMSALSALKGGDAQAAQARYQSSLAWQNYNLRMQDSNYALAAGETKAMQAGMAGAQRQGQIKAAQAASGVAVGSGSAKEVQESAHLVSKMDMDAIRASAAKTAFDYRLAASGEANKARGFEAAGRQALEGARLGAIGSFIGTAGSVASKWLQGQQLGMWGGGGSGVTGRGEGDPLQWWKYSRDGEEA